MVLYMVCCELRPLLSFIWTNGPKITLFRVNCQKDFFYLPFWPVFWSLMLCACRFVFSFGSLDIIELHQGSALTSIVRGDALFDNAVL